MRLYRGPLPEPFLPIPCPLCGKPIVAVEERREDHDRSRAFWDCYWCQRAGSINLSCGAVQEEIVDTQSYKWWDWKGFKRLWKWKKR